MRQSGRFRSKPGPGEERRQGRPAWAGRRASAGWSRRQRRDVRETEEESCQMHRMHAFTWASGWASCLVLVWAAALTAIGIDDRPSQAAAPAAVPSASIPGPNAVVAGELLIEPPTLINLGFEWFVQGDDNRNAAVEVSFRRKGEQAWRAALPLLRLNGERIYSESRVDVILPNMFAGSILDLDPGTDYEARFAMSDPDGVVGQAQRTVQVRTRAEPVPYAAGRVFHVYPHGFKGQKVEPA